MKRDIRSTLLALATSGVVVVGSAACAGASPEPGAENVSSASAAEPQTLSGELQYIAPGELAIGDQAFFVSEETQILAGIYACPAEDGVDENGQGTVECDLETVEEALQDGTVILAGAEVNDDGIATWITEHDPEGPGVPDDGDQDGSGGDDGAAEEPGGFTGTASGELEYVAPGEYIVDGTAFYVAEDTVITAGIYACADGVQDPDTGNVTCDFDEFDATLANGTVILASVEMVDGIATSITEFEA